METVFFIASKLVAYLISVDFLFAAALALLVTALFMNWLRLARGLGLSMLVALVALGFLPLGDMVLRPVERTYPANPPLQNVDGIVVLGGAEDVIASTYWSQPQLGPAADRLVQTVALAQQHPVARVVFAGGSHRLRDIGDLRISEADVVRRIFSSLKLSQNRLLFESTSRNTAENAKRSLELAKPGSGETWVLVTSAFHMHRAMRSFETAGWPKLVPFPVDYRTRAFSDGLGWNLINNVTNLNIAIKEAVGLTAYRLFGV